MERLVSCCVILFTFGCWLIILFTNNNSDGIPQVNADVTATFVKEVAYELEWNEIEDVYPNLITRDYTFIFKYLGNDDQNNNKSLNISVGEGIYINL